MVDPVAFGQAKNLDNPNPKLPETPEARLEWTRAIVNKVDEKYSMALAAEDYKQLTIDLCKSEYRKIIENYVCPICTLVIEDIK